MILITNCFMRLIIMIVSLLKLIGKENLLLFFYICVAKKNQQKISFDFKLPLGFLS